MISPVIDDFFLLTFPLISFIFYSSLNELGKTSSIMLNRSQDREHLCLVSDFKKNAFIRLSFKRCLQLQVLIDTFFFWQWLGGGEGWVCVCRLRMFLLLRDLVLTMNQWWNYELLKIKFLKKSNLAEKWAKNINRQFIDMTHKLWLIYKKLFLTSLIIR